MSKRYIEGIIKVVTPLHVAAMNDGDNDGKAKKESVTYTTKMPIFTDHGRAFLPYFPGNDLRGRMRRRAAEMVLEQVQPVPLKIFHALTCGAGSTAPETGSKSISMTIKSRDDLYLGLFGGGPRLHKSGMRVRSLYPITAATISAGMVPENEACTNAMSGLYGDNPGLPRLVSKYTMVRHDDALNGLNMKAPSRIENYAEAVAEYAEAAAEADANRKDKDRDNPDDRKLGLQNMFGIETINVGTPLYLRIDFDDYLTDAQINLAARCLAQVLAEPVGGWVRAGYGQLRASTLHLVSDSERADVLNGDSISANLPGSEECDEALAGYTIEKLSELLMPSDAGKDGDE